MDGAEARARLFVALRREIRRHWGTIGETEAALRRSSGYFSKVFKNQRTLTLDILLRALDVFEIDPASFFGQALDVVGSPETFLAAIEDRGPVDPALGKLLRVCRRPAVHSPAESEVDQAEAADLVAQLARCSRAQQRRALRQRSVYRQPAFVTAYLDLLEELRYRHPLDTVRLCETVAGELLPALPADSAGQVDLLCRTLGVFGSAHRLLGRLPTAARAVREALVLARRSDLAAATVDSLQRAAYVLSDAALYVRSLAVLREALEICLDRDLDFGRTLVDRGVMLHFAGSRPAAVRVLERAWQRLPDCGPGIERNREAVIQHLALLHTSQGELDRAESWLREGLSRWPDDSTARHARLLWQTGRLGLARRDERSAERHLRQAAEVLDRTGDRRDRVLVRLDLWRALARRPREAGRVVRDLLPGLASFRGSRLPEAVFDQLVRAAFQDDVHPELIERVAGLLQKRPSPWLLP